MSKPRFWPQVWREAVSSYRLYLKQSREHVIGFVVTTTVIFAVLFWAPALGNVQEELGATAALVIAILATAALRFVVELATAPSKIYRRAADRASELEHVLGREEVGDLIRKEVHELYWEGRRFYENETSYKVWWSDEPQDWLRRARAVIERNYDSTVLFIFDTHSNEGRIHKPNGINYPLNHRDLGALLREFRIKLDALESVSHYPLRSERLRQDYPAILTVDAE